MVVSDMETINICAVLSDKDGNYSKYAAVMMASVLRKTSCRVHFFILHDETVMEDIKDDIASLCDLYDSVVDFLLAEVPECWHDIKRLNLYSIWQILYREIALRK